MNGLRLPLPTDRLRKRINRAPSPLLARSVPWITIMLGSLVPAWLVIASAPLLPPFGFLMLIAWRQLRPGLLPVWVGLPLGLFDDLYSGQPLGNAVMLWSLAVIALDMVEARLPWRNFITEWLMAAGLISAYILLSLGIANLTGGSTPVLVILPQIVLSIFLYPLIGRLAAACDRFRLLPFREVR
jgi:rod shape-determining protein MreD